MPTRTQIVCLCEGRKGKSIDEVFVNRLIKSLDPGWLKPWAGSNRLRLVPCGDRNAVMDKVPTELKSCVDAGGNTTLMVWADCDDDCADGEALKQRFWTEAQRRGISRDEFDRVVFIFPKDRLENWIEFLQTGSTNEASEGPRVRHNRDVADAANKLAGFCRSGKPVDGMPPSLQWSCNNWRVLAEHMKP